MSLEVGQEILANDINRLKERVKAEIKRRQKDDSLKIYDSDNQEYEITPDINVKAVTEHYNKIAKPILTINNKSKNVTTEVTLPAEVNENNLINSISLLEKLLADFEKQQEYVEPADCNSECTGLCVSKCTGTCTGGCNDNCATGCTGACGVACTADCTKTCRNQCSGCGDGCSSGCGSGCSGTCVGSCGNGCTSCQGCSNSCSGNYCKGSCLDSCVNFCKTGCLHSSK